MAPFAWIWHKYTNIRETLAEAANAGFQLPPATREVLKYFTFMILFSCSLFIGRPTEEIFFANRNLKELILEDEISFETYPFEKIYYTIIELKDAVNWLEQVLLPTVYDASVPNGDPSALLGVNYILGGARLRQLRVKAVPCTSHPPGLNITECLPQYEAKYDSRETFGPGGEFYWSSQSGYPYEYWGQVTEYPASGYIEDLGPDPEKALARMAFLREANWVDLRTRLILCDVPMYNPNTGLFMDMTWMMEFPAGGGMVASLQWRSAKLYRYETSADMTVLVIEVLFLLMLISYIYQEAKNLRNEGWRKYFGENMWNTIDWINMIMFIVVFALRLTWLLELGKVTISTETFSDIHGVLFMARQEVNINSFNSFCVYFKTFKYLGMVPRMNQLFRTLGNASTDLFLFFIMFFIVYAGFTAAFYLAYSLEVYEYRTMPQTAYSLLRFLLGDFDFYVLYRSNRILTPILFFSYVLFCLYMLLNMFLAILNDSYAEVKEEDSKKPPPDIIGNLKLRARAFMAFVKKRQKQAEVINMNIMAGDTEGDGDLDLQELQAVLDQNAGIGQLLEGVDKDGDGVLTAAEVMAQFDKDGDGELSAEEAKMLEAKLKEGALAAAERDLKQFENQMAAAAGGGYPGDPDDPLIERRPEDEEEDANLAQVELDTKLFAEQAVRPEDLEDMRQMTLTMMEKLNVLTEYILNSPAEVIAAKQLSEISSRLDKMSTLLTAASTY